MIPGSKGGWLWFENLPLFMCVCVCVVQESEPRDFLKITFLGPLNLLTLVITIFVYMFLCAWKHVHTHVEARGQPQVLFLRHYLPCLCLCVCSCTRTCLHVCTCVCICACANQGTTSGVVLQLLSILSFCVDTWRPEDDLKCCSTLGTVYLVFWE